MRKRGDRAPPLFSYFKGRLFGSKGLNEESGRRLRAGTKRSDRQNQSVPGGALVFMRFAPRNEAGKRRLFVIKNNVDVN
jgi:hypothetical protein